MHFVYPPPPQILHNCCFQFLLGITVVPREIEDNGYAEFWVPWSLSRLVVATSRLTLDLLRKEKSRKTSGTRVNFGGQTTCVMAYVRMVNSEHFCQSLGSSLFRGATVSWSLEQTMISRFALLRLPQLSKSKMVTTRGKIWLSVLPKCSLRMKKTVNSHGLKCE